MVKYVIPQLKQFYKNLKINFKYNKLMMFYLKILIYKNSHLEKGLYLVPTQNKMKQSKEYHN